MHIRVERKYFGADSTAGRLYADGKFVCFTLEDKVRPVKIKGETAIPYGTYPVRITWSPRFGQLMPLIKDVPGFSGIRVHSGNTNQQTDGCLLVGMGLNAAKTELTESRAAYAKLYTLIERASGPVRIEFTYEEIETGKKVFLAVVVLAVVAVAYYLIANRKSIPALQNA